LQEVIITIIIIITAIVAIVFQEFSNNFFQVQYFNFI